MSKAGRLLFVLSQLLICCVAQDKYPGPSRLGPFDTSRNESGLKVLEQLGRPAHKSDLYCYQARDGSTFLTLGLSDETPNVVDDVFLSDFPRCAHMPQKAMHTTVTDIRRWRTPEGVGLGSTEADVLKIYGTPNYTHAIDAKASTILLGYHDDDVKPNVGNKSLEYRLADRTRSSEFGIRDGKVAWISMFK